MKPKELYLVLCVAGIVMPYSQSSPFLREHGLDFRLFFQQLFANRAVGVSLGLPLFLYLREERLERSTWAGVRSGSDPHA